jgi:hypothetical protein
LRIPLKVEVAILLFESDCSGFRVEGVGCRSVGPAHHPTRPTGICSVQTMETTIKESQRMRVRITAPVDQRASQMTGR